MGTYYQTTITSKPQFNINGVNTILFLISLFLINMLYSHTSDFLNHKKLPIERQ